MHITISQNFTKPIYQNKKNKEKVYSKTNNFLNITLKNERVLSKDGVQTLKNNISFGISRCNYVEDFHKKLNKPIQNMIRRVRNFNLIILMNRHRLRQILHFSEQERIKRDNLAQIANLKQIVRTINNEYLRENTNLIINTLDNEQSLSSFQTNVKLRLIKKLIEFKNNGCDEISLVESLITPKFINNNNFNVQGANPFNGYKIIVTPLNISDSYVRGVRFAQMDSDIGNVNRVHFNFVKYSGENNYVLDDFKISAKAGESLSNVYVKGDDNEMHNVENVYTLGFGELKSITEPDSYFIDYLVAEPEDDKLIKIDNKTYWYALINNNLRFCNEDHANS